MSDMLAFLLRAQEAMEGNNHSFPHPFTHWGMHGATAQTAILHDCGQPVAPYSLQLQVRLTFPVQA